MKKFKSILALTASVLALSAFAAPVSAFAANPITENNGSGTSTVQDTVQAGFTVTIPADVTFSSTSETGTLKAEGTATGSPIVLAAGKELNVSVASKNGLKLRLNNANDGAILAPYSVTASASTATVNSDLSGMSTAGSPVELATFANNTTDTVTLTFTEGTKENVPAGDYQDTLTFTISVDNASV